jgi:simple sugar transport system substrate-binding protein
VALATALLAAALAPTAGTAQDQPSPARFVVVTHGQPSDPFWSVVKNGVDQAARDTGVTVEYQSPQKFDMVAMSQLIDAAVASKPDGLVVSIPDAAALSPSIKRAIDAGIPVISINSGSDAAQQLGVLTHVGQTEYEAGLGGGSRMAAAGARHALCVNQEVGNAALDARCQGFTDGLKQGGGTRVDVLAVDLSNPTDSQQRIQAALAADTSIDSVMTLGPTAAAPAMAALQSMGKTGQIKLATFDLSPEVLHAIQQGTMLFAVDQQQYEQGYLPIVLLKLYHDNLNTIANPVLMTGPGFVTSDNAARVIDLSKAGTR